jgi:signal transduction histidine kinase
VNGIRRFTLKRFRFNSLQTKILFYAFLPFVLVIVIIVIVGFQVFERVPQAVARQRERELARVVAGQVELRLTEAGSTLLRLATELMIRQSDGSGGGIDRDPFDGGIALYSPEGVLLRAEPPAGGWEGLISMELETLVRQRKPTCSDILRDPRSGEPSIVFAVPILSEQGEVQAVAAGAATLSASPLIGSFAALMGFTRNRSGYAYLVDGRGKFVYHRNRSLWGTALAGTVPMMGATYGLSGAVLTRDVSGQRVIAGYSPVAGTDWALITSEQWRVIVGPLRLYSIVLLAVLIGGAAASVLLVLFAVGRILKPIRDLTQGAGRIAEGQFDHRIMAVTGDEIEDLASRFNSMADSLKSLYRGLEQKVASRTAEVLQQQRRLAVLEERSRVARDLHDSVSQSLYSVTLFSEAARRHLSAGNAGAAEQSLDHLIGASRQALKEMRLMVYELRPSELENRGLIGALRQRLSSVEKRAGIEASIDAPADLVLPDYLEQELYSLTQEALNNALRHGNARSVKLRLRQRGEELQLDVRDDGVGFDPHTLRSTGGMGIRGMEERAHALGGRLLVDSAPGEGTLVRVGIPIPERRNHGGRDDSDSHSR